MLACWKAETCSNEGGVIMLANRLHDSEPSADWLCKLLSSLPERGLRNFMEFNPLKLINEHGSNTILKERLELIRDQLSALEARNAELERALTAARAEIEQLRVLVPDARFVEYGGVKFKRKPSGGFESTVYCPTCEVGMATIPGVDLPFTCGKCNALSGFSSKQLSTILGEVQKEYP